MTGTPHLTSPDFSTLMIEESADLARFLSRLPAADWDAASLCAGWKVRHVVSHMAVGHTMPLGRFLLAVALAGGVVPRASHRLALRFGDSHTPDEILAAFSAGTSGPPRGPAGFVPPAELFIDHLIHHQDIRRPLGQRHQIPADRLTAAFQALPVQGGLLKARQRVRGLTLVADDIGCRFGTGPEVHGPAEALIMCAGGRTAALSDLTGPGRTTLAARLG